MAKKIKQDITEDFEYKENLLKNIRDSGYDIRKDISIIKNDNKSIFNLVVFKGEDPVLILETKNTDYKALLYGKISAQIKKYQEYIKNYMSFKSRNKPNYQIIYELISKI
jgi:hypothetical protein